MVGLAQSRNRLEDGRSKDDKMSGGVWKTVKANARKIQMAEIERRRGKERNEKGKWSKRKNNRCEESGRGVGNLR